jgi:hypothetical protein
MTREDLSSKGWGNSGRLPSIGTTHRPTCGTALSPSSNASSLALERVDRALVPEPTSQRHHGAVLRHMSPATCRDRHGDTCQFFFGASTVPVRRRGWSSAQARLQCAAQLVSFSHLTTLPSTPPLYLPLEGGSLGACERALDSACGLPGLFSEARPGEPPGLFREEWPGDVGMRRDRLASRSS